MAVQDFLCGRTRVVMFSPKRFIPPPKQNTQAARLSRPPPFAAARRLVARSIKNSRQRLEKFQLRCVTTVQQFVDSHVPLDYALLPAEFMEIADRDCLQVEKAVGTLLTGGVVTPPGKDAESDSKDEKFLVCAVNILGANGELKEIALRALTIQPNFSYTLREVNQEVDNVMGTGYFKSALLRHDFS